MTYIGNPSSPKSVRRSFLFTASGGETSVSGADDYGNTLVYYNSRYTDVFINGVLQVRDEDYTANDGSSISGIDPALNSGDAVNVIVHNFATYADHYTKPEVDQLLGQAGATGGGNDNVFVENEQTVDNDYTISSGKNAMSTGPITISDGVTVSIPEGSRWTIV